MSNYRESKEKLNKIRREYTCKGDVIFTTAVQYTIEVGQANLNRDSWLQKTLAQIDNRHDKAEKEGKWLFMTRDFEKAIVECARKIAEINTHDLMVYIQREMYLNSGLMDGEPDYQRAIRLIEECLRWLDEDISTMGGTLEVLYDIGFSDDELIHFGYQWLLDEEEE